MWPVFWNVFFPINVHKWIGIRNIAESCLLHLKHRKFTGWMDRWVGQFLQVSGATNSPLLAQAPAGCWDLWDELGVQPKFSLLLQSLSCSVTWVTPQSHSTTKPCFKNSSAYKLGCTDTLQKTCGYLSCCCCSSQAALLQTQNWRCCWLFLKKPAVQKASCHPSKHKIKRRVQFSCMEKRMLIMLVQERKKKALLETPLDARNLLIAVYLPESTWSINSVTELNITLTSFISTSLWS